MSKVDVLSIGAHAGDAEIASGIALAHEVNVGKKVAMCHLTLGEKGHPNMTPEKYGTRKREEAVCAAEVIGAELYVLAYLDGELPVNDEAKHAIADIIRDCKPDTIITHHAKSIHKDHVNCHLNVLDAISGGIWSRATPSSAARSWLFHTWITTRSSRAYEGSRTASPIPSRSASPRAQRPGGSPAFPRPITS